MIARADYTDIFKSKVVASTVIEGLSLSVYANDLLHVKVPKYYSLDLVIFKKSQEWLTQLNPEKNYHFIFDFGSFSDITPEMRRFRATKKGSNFSLSDAAVISSFPQKILSDFYLRVNKPQRPTRVFNSLEKAVEWSLKQQAKLSD